MANGFIRNIFNNLIKNNNKAITENNEAKTSKRTFKGFMDQILNNVSSDQTTRINKKLAQDKNLNVSKIYSMRNYEEGNRPEGNARMWKGENVGRGDEDTGNITEEVRSSAVDSVKYDPGQGLCWVRYVGGNGEWYSFKMNPKQFKTYMQASSKGRYTQNVMREQNYDTEWENHPVPN